MSPEEYYKKFGEWPYGYPQARKSYPNKFAELLATNPVTKFLVPGAERFLQRGQNPSFMDILFAGLGVTPAGRLIPGQIRSVLSKGTPVYHGTTGRFNKPDLRHGANWIPAYGKGFNVTSSPEIANLYGKTLAKKHLDKNPWLPVKPYYVNEYRIPKDAKFLDLEKKLKDQPKDAQEFIVSKLTYMDDATSNTPPNFQKTLDDYGDWPLGEIYFSKFSRGSGMIPNNYQGIKYTDEMFGLDKGGWIDEFGELVTGMPVHPFSPNLYKSGQTNYLIKQKKPYMQEVDDQYGGGMIDLNAKSLFNMLKPVRKRLKLKFDSGLN